jgi:hypothetical protein
MITKFVRLLRNLVRLRLQRLRNFLPLLSGTIAFSKTGGHQWPTTNIAGIIVSHACGVERWRSLL